ncbi:MAG TPA: preprotein translocase subunit SecA, partial [Desulfonauticus sp.]|nr:preprotein translocase subunit SecA [Desulfonauticus sp.]
MLNFLVKKIIGTKNDRYLKKISPLVDQINNLENSVSKLTDDQMRAKIAEYKEQVAKGKPLDELLPEVFALVREAGKRTLNMRHF